MKFRRIVLSTSGAFLQSRSADAIDAQSAPASMAAIIATTRPNRAALNAASAPTMNCPSPPMFHTPARNAITTESPVSISGTDLSNVPWMAKVDPTEPLIRIDNSSIGE